MTLGGMGRGVVGQVLDPSRGLGMKQLRVGNWVVCERLSEKWW